jgi:hypothetical protein
MTQAQFDALIEYINAKIRNHASDEIAIAHAKAETLLVDPS